MSPDELRDFVSECQQEFGTLPPPMKKPRLDTKASGIPSLEFLEQKWAEEDERSTTASGATTRQVPARFPHGS